VLALENAAPADRFLMLEGRCLAPRAGLPPLPSNARVFWVSYAFADLPIGTTFDMLIQRSSAAAFPTRAVLHAVTQQFAKPFDEIPHGWKTIAAFTFPTGIPALVDALPVAASWTGTWSLGLCRAIDVSAIRARL
jgi:hypothetical protein